jgi:tetratricopeptide (TPR) repeat protein
MLDFAGSLYNLGNMQSVLGQREAALASTQEAVDLGRKLAQARPKAFLPYLAMSLNKLSLWQSALGQREAALTSAQEALDAIWPFFLRLPATFERDTGEYLDNLLQHLKALSQPLTS